MKPITFYANTELAESIETNYGSFAQKMTMTEAVLLAQTVLQSLVSEECKDAPLLIFLAELITERVTAGERFSVIPEAIPFKAPVTFEMPY